MPEHICPGCGEIHGAPVADPTVEIARIQADRDVAVARLQRAETTEVVAGEIEQTEIAAGAAVDEAVVRVDVLEELATPPEPEPEPVVIVSDESQAEAEPPAPEAEPPEADPGAAAVPASSGSSNPWW